MKLISEDIVFPCSLSWKNSYIASLNDHKRTYITYAELARDWVLKFGEDLELGTASSPSATSLPPPLLSLPSSLSPRKHILSVLSSSLGRVVKQGHAFIDNRGFSARPGEVLVQGDRIYISGIGHTLKRNASWGWIWEGMFLLLLLLLLLLPLLSSFSFAYPSPSYPPLPPSLIIFDAPISRFSLDLFPSLIFFRTSFLPSA